MELKRGDMAVNPAEVTHVVVAEHRLDLRGVGGPLREAVERHVGAVVAGFPRVFAEDGLARILHVLRGDGRILIKSCAISRERVFCAIPSVAFQIEARIAVGGVFQIIVESCIKAFDASAWIIVNGHGGGAAEYFEVADVTAHADGPIDLVAGVVLVLVVVEILRPTAAVGVDVGRAVAISRVRQAALAVCRVGSHGRADLLEVARAGDGLRLVAGLGERGEEHGGEDRDDGDDDK